MLRRRIMIFVMVVAFSQVGYAQAPDKPLRLTEKDSEKPISVKVGDTIEVVLKENPTTGFLWVVDTLDKAFLEQTGEKEYKPDSDAIGAGGIMTMRFRAIASGQTKFKLIYHRGGEKGNRAAKTFKTTITIEPKT
ncbi:MAG: protease inhibitor I42 family protein [Planctomycetota bacterium]